MHEDQKGRSGSGESLGRRARLNTVVIPQMRALGFVAVLALCGLHHALVSAYVSDRSLVLFIAGVAAYNLMSWLTLVFFYTKSTRLDLGAIFLYVDVVLFGSAVYVTGAENSWLLLILVLRAADQAANGFVTVLRFAHWSATVYLGLVLYVHFGEHRPLNWSVEFVKLLGIYFANIYVSLTALVLEKMRRQMRNARDLIVELQRKARDLDRERARANALSAEKDALTKLLETKLRGPLTGIRDGSLAALAGQLDRDQVKAAAEEALAALDQAAAVAPRTGAAELFDPLDLARGRMRDRGGEILTRGPLPEQVLGDRGASDSILLMALEAYGRPSNNAAPSLSISEESSNSDHVVLRYTLFGVGHAPAAARKLAQQLGGKCRVILDLDGGPSLRWTLKFAHPTVSSSPAPVTAGSSSNPSL